jgi:phage terminase small subunit
MATKSPLVTLQGKPRRPNTRLTPLTAKQQQFCREYLIDLNATQAAIRAGYSSKAAGAIAKETLLIPAVQQALQLMRDKRAARVDVTADRVVLELARIGFADPRKLVDAKGRPLPLHELDDNTAAALSSVEFVTGRYGTVIRKYRFVPKPPALEMLGRHLGIFADKGAVPTDDRGSVSLKDALVYYREMLVMRGGEGRVPDGAIVDTTRGLDG